MSGIPTLGCRCLGTEDQETQGSALRTRSKRDTYNDIFDYNIISNTVADRAVEMDTNTSPRYFGVI